MNNFFKTFLASLLAFIVGIIGCFFVSLLFVAGITAMISGEESKLEIKNNSILKINLAQALVEKPSENIFDGFDYTTLTFTPSTTLLDAISLIEKAAIDPSISGIYLDLPMAIPMSVSALYELREALKKFRETSGEKFVISHADVLTQGGLYLASVGDRTYLNPHGMIEWSGMGGSVMFYKGTLDKLGIEPEIIRHGKFKGAVEPYILDKLSPENRDQTQQMLNSTWGYIVSEIAQSRNMDSALMQQQASDLTLSSPQIALQYGYVDSLFYKDQLIDEFKRLTGSDKPNVVSLSQYRRTGFSVAGSDILATNQVAVLYADGQMMDAGDGSLIVGDRFSSELRQLRENDNVKAVVLRVNSPGGSVLAADVIWREVLLTRQVKPVIVSMGSMAASGGYYISAPADMIYANPTTLTGSIGVFGMLFNVEKGAREKLGLTVDVVKTNPSADMGNIFRPLTTVEHQWMQNSVDSTYLRFTELVSQGRKMPIERVDELGSGRVWTGIEALQNGLVDRLGTLTMAIEEAIIRAGIESDYRVKCYPEIDNSFGAIFASITQSSIKSIFKGAVSTEIYDLQKQASEILDQQGVIQVRVPYQVDVKL